MQKTQPERSLIDKLDRKVLQLLERDARMSFASIAKKTGVPEETVRYRVRQLFEQGVILSYFTIIDAGKLGNNYFKVCLKLVSVSQKVLDQITKHLTESSMVNWVARFEGVFDIGFTIRVRRLHELEEFLAELRRRYHRYLSRITFAVNLEVDFLNRCYLEDRSDSSERGAAYTTPYSKVEIDELDLSILRMLSTDPRGSANAASAELGVSYPTYARRVQRLEEQGVIRRYSILPDCRKLGLSNYYVFVYLHQVSQKRLNNFIAYCKSLPQVVYFIKALGEWDHELNLEVSSFQEYHEIMMNLTRNSEGIIRDYLGLPVHEVYKLTLSP